MELSERGMDEPFGKVGERVGRAAGFGWSASSDRCSLAPAHSPND